MCYYSTTMFCFYFLNSFCLTFFHQSMSQFLTYVPENYSCKMLSGLETGVTLCLWEISSQLKTIYSVLLKKGEDHKKSLTFPHDKKWKEIK